MKIIRCRLVPKDYCVNILGTVWTRDPSWLDARWLNHERIHTAQQRELLFVGFYIAYAVEWLWRMVKMGDHRAAYRSLSFEREAYDNAAAPDYLSHRRHYAMWRRSTLG